MKPVVAIAMSGGIDSLVSAFLLKNEGVSVFGIHFITGFEPKDAAPPHDVITKLSSLVGFPVHLLDLSHDFRTVVVDYFIRGYLGGTTPNPCLVCNPTIKFDLLYEAARKLGADQLATGHYARVTEDDGGIFHLFKGADHVKDQSYFLSFLSQKQLSRARFPLGELTKDDVKRFAAEKGLAPSFENESQDICFIHNRRYADFLSNYGEVQSTPGPVLTTLGETIGRHDGLHRFTVGQRRGINCPSSEPYYVIRLETDKNALVVGRKNELAMESCTVENPHWISGRPKLPHPVDVRLRYRHRAVPAIISEHRDGRLNVSFKTPQDAPTPGQGAVFYEEDEVIGAGIITA